MHPRKMFALAGGECCQSGIVAKSNTNSQLGVFNIVFRHGLRLNYLVFCSIEHINTFVFCLKNMI